MSYFAAAVVRDVHGWTAAELDISGAADVEDVAERLRDIDPDLETFVSCDTAEKYRWALAKTGT